MHIPARAYFSNEKKFTTGKVKMRKPWNRVPTQVYSLATKGNMNICTYVVPISLKPKKYMVALYKGTKTLENIKKTKKGVLQFLNHKQSTFVKKLGYKSGHTSNKLKNLQLELFQEVEVLPDCLAYLELHFEKLIDVNADHMLGIASVKKIKNNNELRPLTLEQLQKEKIVR